MDPLDKPRRIFPNFYLGNYKSSQDRYVLYDFNISHILTVGVGMPAKFPDYFKYMVLDDVLDIEDQNIRKYFKDAYEFIETGRNKGTGVLVHCMSGVSRGPSFCAMYLMAKLQVPLEDAFDLVRYASPNMCPNDGFMHQLRGFEKRVKKMTNVTGNEASGSSSDNNSNNNNKVETSSDNSGNKSDSTRVDSVEAVVNTKSESLGKNEPKVEQEIPIVDKIDNNTPLQDLVSSLSIESPTLIQTPQIPTLTSSSIPDNTQTHTSTTVTETSSESNSVDSKNVQITDSSSSDNANGFPEAPNLRYCCRKCGRTVFTSEDIMEHRTGRGQDMFEWHKRVHNVPKSIVPACTSYFLN
eukprot:TRINITY_DN3637_c0_g1_i4.p1 TRINITY_DN3637_c0_g1~~TRINITY_DN3637_c0_g1_i4.p1  ORF type:complete len:353 (+),score=60.50 TRINITY_DN3637_c0_g1_i4:206-1264(+)